MIDRVVRSYTAHQTGYGSAIFKEVRGLTKEEKDALRDGALLIYDSKVPVYGTHGTTFRKVFLKKIGNREFYNPRRLTDQELQVCIECGFIQEAWK